MSSPVHKINYRSPVTRRLGDLPIGTYFKFGCAPDSSDTVYMVIRPVSFSEHAAPAPNPGTSSLSPASAGWVQYVSIMSGDICTTTASSRVWALDRVVITSEVVR